MLAIWKGLNTFQGQSKASTWIFGIARHKAIDALRKVTKQRGKTLLDEIIDKTASNENPFEDARQQQEAALIKQALRTLSTDHREILHVAFYEELSYPEISKLIGIPVNTVKTRVYYAKQQLKKSLTHQGMTRNII